MRILLLSAYDAVSHRQWRLWLESYCCDYQWQVLTLPARHFSWRVRGNPLSWLQTHQQVLNDHYDCLVATSMVDLSTLRGLVPSLAQVPTLVYCHENQFSYPQSAQQHVSIEAKMVFLYACLCAETIAFNSVHNRETALSGMRDLLKHLPENQNLGLVERIAQKSLVLPVPVEGGDLPGRDHADNGNETGRIQGATPADTSELHCVWNHRWEYDKGPERLLAFVQALEQHSGIPIYLHIVGQQFRRQPVEFEQIRSVIESSAHLKLGRWGWIESRDDYLQLLLQCDVALSTSLHDFQGLAIHEAVACGCVPLLPDRLAYPEFFPADYLYASSESVEQEAIAMAGLLQQWVGQGLPERPDMSAVSEVELGPRYHQTLQQLLVTGPKQ